MIERHLIEQQLKKESELLFMVYYHLDRAESNLRGMTNKTIDKRIKNVLLAGELKKIKPKLEKLRMMFDETFGNISETYGDQFDELDELFSKEVQLNIKL